VAIQIYLDHKLLIGEQHYGVEIKWSSNYW